MLKVKNLNWSDRKYIRAGVIPTLQYRGTSFYGFGVENGIASLVDFGGHVEKTDQDALDAALREYSEEAFDVFGSFTRDMVQEYYVLDGEDTAEILLPVDNHISPYEYTLKFRELIGNDMSKEAQNLIWLTPAQLLTVIDNQNTSYNGTKLYIMYSRILTTLKNNRQYI